MSRFAVTASLVSSISANSSHRDQGSQDPRRLVRQKVGHCDSSDLRFLRLERCTTRRSERFARYVSTRVWEILKGITRRK